MRGGTDVFVMKHIARHQLRNLCQLATVGRISLFPSHKNGSKISNRNGDENQIDACFRDLDIRSNVVEFPSRKEPVNLFCYVGGSKGIANFY